MEIRIRSTGAVLSDDGFRKYVQDTYQASFAEITPEILTQFGADAVLDGPAPVLARYQTAYRDGVQEINGEWVTKWTIQDLVGPEEKKQIDDWQAAAVRIERDRLLTISDWTQMPDNNLATKANWATYRQALRDLPSQSGFPWDVHMPEQPK